jgi:hypothetical protein
LKVKFLSGQTDCPLHIESQQWKKLKVYWSINLQREKSAKMANARYQIKNYSSHGKKDKAGKEVNLICTFPGIINVFGFHLTMRTVVEVLSFLELI